MEEGPFSRREAETILRSFSTCGYDACDDLKQALGKCYEQGMQGGGEVPDLPDVDFHQWEHMDSSSQEQREKSVI